MENKFMQRALELAQKGLGFTSPNPCVGAVIVKGGEIIAEGYHKKAGEDHAEVIAIKELMKKSGVTTVDLEPSLFHNATLYVTLEPCSHVGKTPSCAKAVALTSFKKVCVGMKDPSAKVNGKGIKIIKAAGIEVELLNSNTKLSDKIRELNQPFIKMAVEGMPYVVLKAGVSLDGKIAPVDGDSKWITSTAARKDARVLRSMHDAVLVGSGTVKEDDCTLAAHGKFKNKPLLRIILDKKLTLKTDLKVFRDENVFVACSDLASAAAKAKFKKAGIAFKSFGKEEVSVKRLLKHLAKMDVMSVFVEGGSSIHGTFFDQSRKDSTLLDSVLFYIAPTLIGGRKSKSAIGGAGILSLSQAPLLQSFEVEKIGDDVKVQGELVKY